MGNAGLAVGSLNTRIKLITKGLYRTPGSLVDAGNLSATVGIDADHMEADSKAELQPQAPIQRPKERPVTNG